MDNRKYSLGLCEVVKLECDKDGKYYYYSFNNGEKILVVGDINNESMKLMKKGKGIRLMSFVEEKKIERNVIKDIYEDGTRWEGDWYNEKPFGFGSVYDGEGNRIYSGFMFEGKKIGFGTEFFSDNHKVDYCGNFMNDKRHGWGTTYDRNGQKMYEGEWACGNNHYQQLTIEDNYPSNLIEIHNSMKEFIIGEGCFNNVRDDLEIYNYPNLEKIIVKKDSFRLLNAFRVFNNERLTEIEIEGGNEEGNGKGAFYEVNEVVISSSSHFLLLLSRSS